MARLIFSHAEILDSSGNQLSPTEEIYGITVEGLEQTLTPDIVTVEDNREVYESFTGKIVVRTINTNFDANQAGALILSSDYVSTDGTLPDVGCLRLHGKTGSHDITTAPTYIMGHNDFSNGRLEIVLSAQASDVNSQDALVVSDPA